MPIKSKSYIYYTNARVGSICDIESCAQSENTVDIRFFDLAKNQQALSLLNLIYLPNIDGYIQDRLERARWFADYLLQLNTRIDYHAANEKLMQNPMLRILFFDQNKMISFANSLNQHQTYSK